MPVVKLFEVRLIAPRGIAPTVPPKTILPMPALSVRLWGPIASLVSVLLNVIFCPLAELSKLVVPVKVAAVANETVPPVVNAPARLFDPAPFWVSAPAIEFVNPLAKVSMPELLMITEPSEAPPNKLLVVVILPLKEKAAPVSWIPFTPFVLTA